MAQQSKTIDESGNEVLDARKALMEQTLAVDLARVELDHQIATAHKFPRSLDVVIKKIRTVSCYNKESAENCVYALPRGGKPIIGPSIGFASIVYQSWGNCRVRSAITYVDRKERTVIANGYFFDLETNAEVITPVTRRIVDKQGRLYNDDMINVTGMAAASIGARNAVLRGVSRGIWFPIWQECFGIVRGDATTFSENKDKAVKAMAQFGVKPDQLWMYLGLKGEIELTLEHIPTLRGMYAALRDGSVTVEEMFDPRRMTGKGFETVENPLGEAPHDEGAGEADPTAGMGEAPTAATQTVPAGQAAAPPVAQNAPAATQAAPGKNNGQASPVAAARADPEPAKPAAPGRPSAKTPEEYLSYWEDFLGAAKTAVEVKNQWSADRVVRGACRVIGGDLEMAKTMRETREAELTGAA